MFNNNGNGISNGSPKIGFYVCHCGHNIASMVDVEEIQKYIASTNVYSAVVVTNWIKFETKTI